MGMGVCAAGKLVEPRASTYTVNAQEYTCNQQFITLMRSMRNDTAWMTSLTPSCLHG